jgi:Fic family protein
LPRFLDRFEAVYSKLGKAETILSSAAAHHRLLWIHPFLDGNGRVARLMSYAMLRQALDTGGIWSIARGLARQETKYKAHLIACDQPRQGDLDGRGSRSEAALAAFTEFFLQTCIDQVTFMEQLVQPNKLRERIRRWVEEEVRTDSLPPQAANVLEAVLYRGELARGDVSGIVGTGDRQARRIISTLLAAGVLQSESIRSPLRIAFPAALAGRWMPGMFPEA